MSLHDQKTQLRDIHQALVGTVARKAGIDHRRLNAELINERVEESIKL